MQKWNRIYHNKNNTNTMAKLEFDVICTHVYAL